MTKKTLLAFLFFIPCSVFAQKSPCDSTRQSNTGISVPTDTTITLNNGTQLTFNRCEFFDIRNCVEYKEIRTLKDLQANGLSTLDNNGNVLLSCGMFILDFSSGNCGSRCLNNPVKIRIPMLFSSCVSSNQTNRLFSADSLGKWKPLNSPYKEVIGNDGKKYFEFHTTCGGKFNCDKKIFYTKVKFKAKGGKRLDNLNVSSNCPLLNMDFTTGRRKNIIYAKIPCADPDSLIITVSGEGINMSKPLSRLFSKFTRSKCALKSARVVRRSLGLIRFRERNIYRKYIIE